MTNLESIPESGYYVDKFGTYEPHRFAVIKIGGGIIGNPEQLTAMADALVQIQSHNLYPTIVHGGGDQIDEALAARGYSSERDSKDLRITPTGHMPVIQSVLRGVNIKMCHAVRQQGGGTYSVIDIFEALLSDYSNLASVSAITHINTEPIAAALAAAELPIVSCIGHLAMKGCKQAVNINADIAATALAKTMRPHKFVFLTPVGAIYDSKGKPISKISDVELEHKIDNKEITGGMAVKARSVIEALVDVEHVVITSPKHLIKEFFSHGGAGTLIYRAPQ